MTSPQLPAGFQDLLASNKAPTNAEASTLLPLLLALDAEVEQLSVAHATLKARLDSLGHELAAKKDAAVAARRVFSVIRRVPDDVLGELFLALAGTDGAPVSDPRNHGVAVSQVCHQWRTVALQTRQLWSAIRLESSTMLRAARLDELLSRSGSKLLSVVIDSGPYAESLLFHILRAPGVPARLGSVNASITSSAAPTLERMSLTLPKLHTLRLTIECEDKGLWEVDSVLKGLTNRPALRHLAIATAHDASQALAPTTQLFMKDALANLESLDLRLPVDIHAVRLLLTAATRLRSCTVREVMPRGGDGTAMEVTALPALEELTLVVSSHNEFDYQVPYSILDAFSLPNLRSLTLDGIFTRALQKHDYLTRLHQRSGFSLDRLHLGAGYMVGDILGLIQTNPDITDLAVIPIGDLPAFLCYCPEDRVAPLLPKLSRFSVTLKDTIGFPAMFAVDGGGLAAMLNSRCRVQPSDTERCVRLADVRLEIGGLAFSDAAEDELRKLVQDGLIVDVTKRARPQMREAGPLPRMRMPMRRAAPGRA